MGASASRKQAVIDDTFAASPHDVNCWDIYHVKKLYAKYRADSYDFAIDRKALNNLLGTALPSTRCLTENFWNQFVLTGGVLEAGGCELLHALELISALTLQCYGVTRAKAQLLFAMFDMMDKAFITYDELSILLSTVAGAAQVVAGKVVVTGKDKSTGEDIVAAVMPLEEYRFDELADDCFVVAGKDLKGGITPDEWLTWLQTKIDLDSSTSLSDLLRAMGMLKEPKTDPVDNCDEEQQQQQ